MTLLRSVLFSTRLTALLFISFATAMAVGTFLESSYGTPAARILVYNAKWFELIMVLFLINFIGNIGRYRLFRKEKWTILLLHLSFVFIILGAFVTRYIGYEGSMPIREGATSDNFLSEKTYLTILIDGDVNGKDLRKTVRKPLLLSEHTNNHFSIDEDFKGQDINIVYKNYYDHAKEGVTPDSHGEDYLKIVEATNGNRHEHYIKSGEVQNLHNLLIALNKPTEGAINLRTEGEYYTIDSPFEGEYMRMLDRKQGTLNKNKLDTLHLRSLYRIGDLQIVFPEPIIKGKKGVIPSDEKDPLAEEALVLDIQTNGKSEQVTLLGGKGHHNPYNTISLDRLKFHISFGSVVRELPFSITLKDFIASRYPGTEKRYSSFKSKVRVNDKTSFDYDIYMNHILEHGGYRFFQASFDTDELGTILSVNHDFWGTWITYIGYFLLYAGLLCFMFFGDTRFVKLGKKLKELKGKQTIIVVLIMLYTSYGWTQHQHQTKTNQKQVDSIVQANIVPRAEARLFGEVVTQDDDGRMKPINTFSSQLLRKVSKSDYYKNLNADQVLLSMLQHPRAWYFMPVIYISRGNDSLRRVIGINSKNKYARLVDFFDEKGQYKLAPFLKDAYTTSTPNQFQKDYKSIDLRLGLLERVLRRRILKLFPVPDDLNNKWINSSEISKYPNVVSDTLYANFIQNSLKYYLGSLQKGKTEGNFEQAHNVLKAIQKNQRNHSDEIMPSEAKVYAELLYNKYDIFKKLFSYYLYLGSLLLIGLIIQIFYPNKLLHITSKILKYGVFILFALHTLGLIARWYISGHAPWSDAYESIIYVAWATMGMGMLFAKRSLLTLAATAFITAMVLMIAHWNWLDPDITNLQPVLNSYWLMIHVAIIVASYGPFTLGMILGLVSLLLIIFNTKSRKSRIKIALQELAIINEQSLTVGLVMLSIGTFLGGQWANESWGRYWGWDPKETWALISVMVYAFVIHMRLVPKLRGLFAFNIASVVAYASILMTYFGVNFYLVGLHSYASGGQVVTPMFVYYAITFVGLIGGVAYFRYRKYLGDDIT